VARADSLRRFLLLTGLLLVLGPSLPRVLGYTYYGFIPREIWGIEAAKMAGHDVAEWRVDNRTIMTRGLVAVVGNHDDTRVKVYALPSGGLVQELTVNRFEKALVPLPNGSFFKVTSDKVASVFLIGGWGMEQGLSSPTMFLTSVDGGYAGREFILLALQSQAGLPYRVYALEDSEVTVYDANGSQVTAFRLSANQRRDLGLGSLRVYRLVSTGKVMLQEWTGGTCFYPSVGGGFLGRQFIGGAFPTESWQGYMPPAYVATGLEGSKLTIFDVEFKKKYDEKTLTASSNLTMQIKVRDIVVESEKPILLMYWGGGVTYAGLKAGQEAYVYLPTKVFATAGEAYLFAYKETTVTVDDAALRLAPDEVLPLPEGFHRLSTNENVLIELANWAAPSEIYAGTRTRIPAINRLSNFGACIPSAESLSLGGDLRLKPVLGGEIPWTYAIAGAAAAVVVAILAVMLRRGRKA